jgi:hypothetical protein
MKKVKVFMAAIGLLAGVGMWYACDDEGGENHDGANHNVGNDCLVCHKANGGGEGVFTAGGTVYKAGTTNGAADATIRLYSNPEGTGTPVVTMTSEVSGNFHTKTAIAFGTGLYAKVTSPAGTSSMSSPITTGACNGCHGVTTGKITVQ